MFVSFSTLDLTKRSIFDLVPGSSSLIVGKGGSKTYLRDRGDTGDETMGIC